MIDLVTGNNTQLSYSAITIVLLDTFLNGIVECGRGNKNRHGNVRQYCQKMAEPGPTLAPVAPVVTLAGTMAGTTPHTWSLPATQHKTFNDFLRQTYHRHYHFSHYLLGYFPCYHDPCFCSIVLTRNSSFLGVQ